jgi:hypothetical protein
MKNKEKILIVDDHPFIIEGYKKRSRYLPDQFEFYNSSKRL